VSLTVRILWLSVRSQAFWYLVKTRYHTCESHHPFQNWNMFVQTLTSYAIWTLLEVEVPDQYLQPVVADCKHLELSP
jgi:hypothetical protein